MQPYSSENWETNPRVDKFVHGFFFFNLYLSSKAKADSFHGCEPVGFQVHLEHWCLCWKRFFGFKVNKRISREGRAILKELRIEFDLTKDAMKKPTNQPSFIFRSREQISKIRTGSPERRDIRNTVYLGSQKAPSRWRDHPNNAYNAYQWIIVSAINFMPLIIIINPVRPALVVPKVVKIVQNLSQADSTISSITSWLIMIFLD